MAPSKFDLRCWTNIQICFCYYDLHLSSVGEAGEEGDQPFTLPFSPFKGGDGLDVGMLNVLLSGNKGKHNCEKQCQIFLQTLFRILVCR